MKYAFLLVIIILKSLFVVSQEKHTISGFVRESESAEEILNVNILVLENTEYHVISNSNGFYSITLPAGNYTLAVYHTGFDAFTENIVLDSNLRKDIYLTTLKKSMEEIVISTNKKDKNVTSIEVGTVDLKVKDLDKIPVLLGEKDILKTIQLLPGIQSAGDGSAGYFVRGSNSDQNLILLDDATVYNSSHLLGFFSTFNSDALKDMKMIKGNFPAQYGGRVASVLDIKMKEGNLRKYHVSGGIGIISSRATVEGPIVKDKSSFIISGRRTYFDLLAAIVSEEFRNNSLYFYDLNAKVNLKINNKNRLYLSGYFGRDVQNIGADFNADWGNYTGTARWKSVLHSKLFSNTTFLITNYDYKLGFKDLFNNTKSEVSANLLDYTLQQEFEFFPSVNQTWKAGFNITYHTISPSRATTTIDPSTKSTRSVQDYYSLENAVYISNLTTLGKFIFETGLRVNIFSVMGDRKYNIYDKGIVKQTIQLGSGEIGETYYNLEPRVAINFRAFQNASFKMAYNRNVQNLHLLSNTTTSFPTDQWISSTYNIKPTLADQGALGYFHNFLDNKYEFSVESYFKYLQNEVDYKDGANLFSAKDLEAELLYGIGRAYGIEFMFKKNAGKFTGWISYTLSKTERQIDGVNQGNWYNARQDRPHYLTLVGTYQFNAKWSVSANFIYYSGNATSFPSGKLRVDRETYYYYSERNGYRMPDYHRLDLSATYESIWFKKYKYSLNFSLYNAYGYENAFIIRFVRDPGDKNKLFAEQIALFRWVPSITLNFEF